LFSQIIQSPKTPAFNNNTPVNLNNGTTINQNKTTTSYSNENTETKNNTTTTPINNSHFNTSYKPPTVNEHQNNQTLQVVNMFDEYKQPDGYIKQLWELKLKPFSFTNTSSASYQSSQKYYNSTYDSINNMLEGKQELDLKKAVFLVENAFTGNKLNYAEFCRLIDNKVYILKQILKNEKLNKNNNVALNYAIQKLFTQQVKYIDKNGVAKIHNPLKYDFDDYMGDRDYTKQFVSKLLVSGKGQCHSMPLLYLILANEIGAKANIAYSPNHSYIAFPDNEGNYYNFETTSGGFTSYSFIMSSGYIKSEAVKSGIYTIPVSLKQVIANQLNDLANQHYQQQKGIDDFQLKCAKRCLEFFPNNIMALQTISNYQTAKCEAELYYCNYPKIENFARYPKLKTEFEKRNDMYDYIDNLGYSQMPNEAYQQWLQSLDLEKTKQENEQIKKFIVEKIKQ
jgi:hypothetical protein